MLACWRAKLAPPVAWDFRTADVAAGGQGAPLVPVFHAALAANLEKPLAVLNIGGVANVTWIGVDTVAAWDTGPGNALLDDFCARHLGEPMDRDGVLCAAGAPHEPTLAALLENPFFARPAPKSLDRQDFAAALGRVESLAPADAAATLAAFTARAVAAKPLAGTAAAGARDRRWPPQPRDHGRPPRRPPLQGGSCGNCRLGR